MMDLNSAIQHCKEQVQEQAKKGCYSCAEEHQQLAEWLKELKAYKDARAEINQALNDDARGDQNDYERGRKSGIFLCESIISVKLGESRSEIPNTCGDAISRQSAIFLASDLKQDLPDDERIADMVMAHNEGILEYQTQLSLLPSVTPQQKTKQRTGRWIQKEEEGEAEPFIIWECSECHCVDEDGKPSYKYCPQCGAKMEVNNESY